jgi:hypothetical protein
LVIVKLVIVVVTVAHENLDFIDQECTGRVLWVVYREGTMK